MKISLTESWTSRFLSMNHVIDQVIQEEVENAQKAQEAIQKEKKAARRKSCDLASDFYDFHLFRNAKYLLKSLQCDKLRRKIS